MSHKKSPVTRAKAKKILHHKQIRGHKLSSKQRGMFGAIASGKYGHKRKRY